MEINYVLVGVSVIFGLWLVIFLIRRNQRDKREYEKQKMFSELDPEKHVNEEKKI